MTHKGPGPCHNIKLQLKLRYLSPPTNFPLIPTNAQELLNHSNQSPARRRSFYPECSGCAGRHTDLHSNILFPEWLPTLRRIIQVRHSAIAFFWGKLLTNFFQSWRGDGSCFWKTSSRVEGDQSCTRRCNEFEPYRYTRRGARCGQQSWDCGGWHESEERERAYVRPCHLEDVCSWAQLIGTSGEGAKEGGKAGKI